MTDPISNEQLAGVSLRRFSDRYSLLADGTIDTRLVQIRFHTPELLGDHVGGDVADRVIHQLTVPTEALLWRTWGDVWFQLRYRW